MIASEERLVVSCKMDATVATGVWLNFPASAASAHSRAVAGRLYLQLLQEEQIKSKKKKKRKETAKEMRNRLLQEVEKRIVQRDNEDFVLLLAI